MKKLTILAVLFALSASPLTGCRFGSGDDTTTTGNPHTLPETTGATITMPTESTTRQTLPTMPSTDRNDPTGTEGTNGTDGATKTDPESRNTNRSRAPGRY